MTVEIEMAEAYPLVNGNGIPNGVPHRDLFDIPELETLNGRDYVPGASILPEQVAYSLSSTIFQYTDGLPENDSAVTVWSKSGQHNPLGIVPAVEQLQTRSGAGTFVLGHSVSHDIKDRLYPDSVFATSATLGEMRPVLDQLSLNYHAFKPVVAHVAAIDSDSTANFVTDYVTPLRTARESGLAAIISKASDEIQYISILASLFATVIPTLHVYDGIRLARELTQVANVLPAGAVYQFFETVRRGIPSTRKPDAVPQLTNLLTAFNYSLNTRFSFFEYVGHPSATTVLVVLGSTEASLANAVSNVLAHQGVPVGVINVRIYQPFSDPEFFVTLPKSTQRIAVLGQVDANDTRSILYEDVLAAVTSADIAVRIDDIQYPKQQAWSMETFSWIFQQLVTDVKEVSLIPDVEALPTYLPICNDAAKKYVFWDFDDSVSSVTARKVVQHFASEPTLTVCFNEIYDNFSQAGTLYSELRAAKVGSMFPNGPIDLAEAVVLADVSIANSFDVIKRVAPGGKVLLKTTIKPEDLEKKLPTPLRKSLFSRRNDIEVYTINPKDVGQVGEGDFADNIVLEIAFLKLVGWQEDIHKIAHDTCSNDVDNFAIVLQGVTKIKENIDASLRRIEIPESWAELEDTKPLPTVPRGNAYSPNTDKLEPVEPEAELSTWQTAAQQIMFTESHEFQNMLRPELPIKNWIVRVQENKRLTPLSYDRNIFHIEFDLTGTDLKYSIGESLGVHSQNDEQQVECFIKWYGLNADAVISVPAKEYPGYYETKTVRQLFVQNLDIFGKPPKKFYELLSEFATDEKQKTRLLALGGTEGAVEFKRRAEVETLTFADILEEFPSAKPSLSELIRIVPPIKRREYSIASSQRAHPTSVHLLVVEVNWRDEKNRDRYGHATRYLSQLPIGSKVTVSIKPSVMKLPADDMTPIIMAGLGTGLAPFRAFVQERALQRSLGKNIGPVFLYMGSRHQREEYLYVILRGLTKFVVTEKNGKHIEMRGLSHFSERHSPEISQRKSTSKTSCAVLSKRSSKHLSPRRVVSTCADRYKSFLNRH
jgi:sulfite reductase (NADPH) flavoprotein alpha-component